MIRALLACTLALAIAALNGCDESGPSGRTDGGPSQTPQAIDLAGLKDRVDAASGEDKVLIVQFWATDCQPCTDSFVGIQALADRETLGQVYSEISVVSVNLDRPGKAGVTGAEKAGRFLARQKDLSDPFKDAFIAEGTDASALVQGLGASWPGEGPPPVLVFDKAGQMVKAVTATENRVQAVADAALAAAHDRLATAPAAPDELTPIDLAGIQKRIDQAAAEDQVLVIDFWAMWCPPCKAMYDDIHAIGELPGVELISVNFDGEVDQDKAEAFLRKRSYNAFKNAYTVTNPEEQFRIVEAFNPEWTAVALPAILVFNQDGKLKLGTTAEMNLSETKKAVRAAVDELLPEQSTPEEQNGAAPAAPDNEDVPAEQ